MQVVGLKISCRGSVGTLIFSYFLNKFSYFFLFVLSRNSYFPIFFEQPCRLTPWIYFLRLIYLFSLIFYVIACRAVLYCSVLYCGVIYVLYCVILCCVEQVGTSFDLQTCVQLALRLANDDLHELAFKFAHA